MSLQVTFDQFAQRLSNKYVIKPIIRIGSSGLESKGTPKIENISDEAQESAAGNARSGDNQNLTRKVDHYIK